MSNNVYHLTYQCIYCGDPATEWDHLHPLVKNKKPTGFISEIHNLVPSCSKCNESKGNKEWKTWMLSNARLSPKKREISDIEKRIQHLEAYEKWGEPIQKKFESIVDSKLWEQHWNNCEKIKELMKISQILAQEINEVIIHEYKESRLLFENHQTKVIIR